MKRKSNSKPKLRDHGSHKTRKFAPEFTGKAQMTREGYIFVMVEGQDNDIYVKSAKTRHALNGDLVRVAVTHPGGGKQRREGEVVEILERSKAPFVGFMHYIGAQAWVLMQSKFMPYDIMVDAEQARSMGAEPGMKVAAVVDNWPRGELSPFGHLVDVLGMPGDNDTEMHAILAEFNLPYRFEKNVENAADKISEAIGPEELKGRKDFRDVLTFTIDPSDAKDFDDALSFRRLSNGNYEVGVHIADVSYYVKPGGAVDKEARERGTSVYLVDRTVPMLPEKLCNKLCSLRQDEDKLTFSAVFEMGPKGAVKSRWIGRTVICSNARMDYEQAQAIIENPPAEPSALEDAILTLNKLAQIMREARFKAGAINFDRPEMKVEVDDTGKPVRVFQKIARESNNLIEEFMLLANRTVAEFVATGGKMNGVAMKGAKTFVYRIHGEPNYEKLEGLRGFACLPPWANLSTPHSRISPCVPWPRPFTAPTISVTMAWRSSSTRTSPRPSGAIPTSWFTACSPPTCRTAVPPTKAATRKNVSTPPSESSLQPTPSAPASSTNSLSLCKIRWEWSSTAPCPASQTGACTSRLTKPTSRVWSPFVKYAQIFTNSTSPATVW